MTLTLTLRWKRRGREVCLEVRVNLAAVLLWGIGAALVLLR